MTDETELEIGNRVWHGKRLGTVVEIRIYERSCEEAGEPMRCCPDYYDCPETGVRYVVDLDREQRNYIARASELRKFDKRIDAVADECQSALIGGT